MLRLLGVCVAMCATLLVSSSSLAAADERSTLRAACEKGDTTKCTAMLSTMQPAEWDAWFTSKGVTIYEAACLKDGGGICSWVTGHFNDGKLVPRDIPRALRSASRGCSTGDDTGCRVVRAIMWKEPLTMDAAAAEKRCTDGGVDGCYAMARLAASASKTAGNTAALEAVSATISKLCDRGNVGVCYVGGDIHDPSSKLSIADEDKSEVLWRKACHDMKDVFIFSACEAADRIKARKTEKAVVALERDCDQGKVQACADAVVLLDTQYGKETRSAKLAEKACVGGVATSCFVAGRAYLRAPKSLFEMDGVKAVSYLDKACQAKVGAACAMLGKVLSLRDAITQQKQWPCCADADLAKAVAAFDRGCVAGDGESCAELGGRLYAGTGIAADKPRAFASFQRACTLKNADGCIGVATATLTGEGTNKNIAQGVTLLERACDGDGRACVLVGMLLVQGGNGVAADPTKAVAVLDKGCTKAMPDACGVLGTLHFLGMGTIKDEKRGIELSEKACSMGYVKACVELAQLFQAPRPGLSDAERGLKVRDYLSKACSGGYMPACAR